MLKTLFRALTWRTISIAALATVAAVLAGQQVTAGPITGGPGNPPYTKLAAYQGVIAIVPSGGAAVMEIGNNGSDIATSGDLILRPGALIVDPTSNVRVYKNNGTKGSIRVPGDICFGSTDGGPTPDCRNTWNGLGASSLDQVLAVGNKSNASIVLGQGTGSGAGIAYLDVAESTLAPNTRDAISTKELAGANTKSAIYAENNSGTGWAGFFSGRVNITGALTAANQPITQSCFVATTPSPFPAAGSPPGTVYANTYVYYTGYFVSGTIFCGLQANTCQAQWRSPGNTSCNADLIGDSTNPCTPGCNTHCHAAGTLQSPSHYYFCRTS